MPTFIAYKLEDGAVVLIQASEELAPRAPVKAAGVPQVIQAEKTFGQALEGVIHSAQEALKKVKALQADEVELTFGLLATGELGNFAVGKVGVEANYAVTLKWKNRPQEKRPA